MSVPVQIAVCAVVDGAPSVGKGVHVSVSGLYRPPVLRLTHPAAPPPVASMPPKIIISWPVQTAVGSTRELGALEPEIGVQLSVSGS